MIEPVLRVRGVSSFYGSSQALFGVDLRVLRGESVALLGRNGAGKSTVFKTVMGLVHAREGHISVSGIEVLGSRPEYVAVAGVAYVPEDRQVFLRQTVENNLKLGVKPGPHGSRDWTLERVYKLFPVLYPVRARDAGLLSGGQQQMLVIARALLGNPELLLLDEPSQGLSPIIMDQLRELLLTLRHSGITMIVAEQNMRFCMDIAARAIVINQGAIVFDGAMSQFKDDKKLLNRYLSV